MLVPPRQVPSRAPRTWELSLGDYPRGHHTSVVFERLDDLGPDDHLLIACDYEPETLRWQIEGWAPTSTGGTRRLRDQSYGARRSRASAEDPPGDIGTGFSQPGAGYCVGERAPDDDARGQANDDRQVDDCADAHLASHPARPGGE